MNQVVSTQINECPKDLSACAEFQRRVKGLYRSEDSATNEFERIMIRNMNAQFKEHENKIITLAKLGLLRIKFSS